MATLGTSLGSAPRLHPESTAPPTLRLPRWGWVQVQLPHSIDHKILVVKNLAVEAQNSVNFKLANLILAKSRSRQAHTRVSKGVIVYAWLGYSYRVYGIRRLDR